MSELTLCPGCGYGSTGGNSFDRLGRRWHDSCFESVHPNAREVLGPEPKCKIVPWCCEPAVSEVKVNESDPWVRVCPLHRSAAFELGYLVRAIQAQVKA